MAEKATKQIVIKLEHEKDTKNKGRYKEVGGAKTMGYAYVDLKELEKIGNPEKITLTITPA
jgi:hypothetical protein